MLPIEQMKGTMWQSIATAEWKMASNVVWLHYWSIDNYHKVIFE